MIIGASIRFCQYSGAIDRVWHIIEVHPNSPATAAGLIAQKGKFDKRSQLNFSILDWIIGCPDVTISSQDDFYNLMIHNTNKPVRLIVFNCDTDACREVTVTPSFDWGGDGWYITSILVIDIYSV